MIENGMRGGGPSEAIQSLILTVDWRYKRNLSPELVKEADRLLTEVLSGLEADGILSLVSEIVFNELGKSLEVKFRRVPSAHPTNRDFSMQICDSPARESIFIVLMEDALFR